MEILVLPVADRRLQEVVRVEDPNGSPSKSAIPVDLEMAGYRGNRPKSAWQDPRRP